MDSLFQNISRKKISSDSDDQLHTAATIGPLRNSKEFYYYHHKYLMRRMQDMTTGDKGVIKIKKEVLEFGKTLNKDFNLLARSPGGTEFGLDFPTQVPVKQVETWHMLAHNVKPTSIFNHLIPFNGEACCKAQDYVQTHLQKEGNYRYVKLEAMYSASSHELKCRVHIDKKSLGKRLNVGVANVLHNVGSVFPIHKEQLKTGDQQIYRIIVAVNEGSAYIKSFLKNFHEACNVPNHLSCALIVVMYKGDINSNTDIEMEIASYKQRTSNSQIVLLDMTEMLLSCSHALKVSRTLTNPGDFVFYVSEYTTLTQKLLNHCSVNILSNYNIYSPLPHLKNDTYNYLQNIVHRAGPVFCAAQSDFIKLHSKLKIMNACSSDFSSLKNDLNFHVLKAFDPVFFIH